MLGNATCEQSCSLTFSFSDIRIIGKGRRIQMKKIAHLLLGRFSIVAVSIILQFLWLVMVMYQFSYQFTYANLAIRTIAIIVVLVIVNRWTNPANKLSWTFIILLSPVLGLLLYMIFGRSSLTKKTQERMDSVNREVSACLYQTPEIKKQLHRLRPLPRIGLCVPPLHGVRHRRRFDGGCHPRRRGAGHRQRPPVLCGDGTL